MRAKAKADADAQMEEDQKLWPIAGGLEEYTLILRALALISRAISTLSLCCIALSVNWKDVRCASAI